MRSAGHHQRAGLHSHTQHKAGQGRGLQAACSGTCRAHAALPGCCQRGGPAPADVCHHGRALLPRPVHRAAEAAGGRVPDAHAVPRGRAPEAEGRGARHACGGGRAQWMGGSTCAAAGRALCCGPEGSSEQAPPLRARVLGSPCCGARVEKRVAQMALRAASCAHAPLAVKRPTTPSGGLGKAVANRGLHSCQSPSMV